MAKKKAIPKPRRGRPPSGRQRLSMILHMKGRPEWGEWVAEFAAAENVPTAELLDIAVTELARKRKFREPPKRI